MSEELDDFAKECRAAGGQKSIGLDVLVFSQRAARSGVNEDLGSRARDGPSKRVFVARIVSSIVMGFRSLTSLTGLPGIPRARISAFTYAFTFSC